MASSDVAVIINIIVFIGVRRKNLHLKRKSSNAGLCSMHTKKWKVNFIEAAGYSFTWQVVLKNWARKCFGLLLYALRTAIPCFMCIVCALIFIFKLRTTWQRNKICITLLRKIFALLSPHTTNNNSWLTFCLYHSRSGARVYVYIRAYSSRDYLMGS